MAEPFKAVEVTDNVYWVGAIDWDVRSLHGCLTSRGTTYNAFLILANDWVCPKCGASKEDFSPALARGINLSG